MAERIVVRAPAKVNLHLAVGPLRPDGFHEVTTVMQAIGLADELTFSEADELTLACADDLGIPAEDNLAYRAAATLAGVLGRSATVAIELVKRIPAGAGLGGGSSDAAAVLRGLARMWGVPAADPRLAEVASALGADVPFFLGAPCALMAGRGDVLVRELAAPACDVVVVWPRVPVPTAAAYRAFDAAPPPAPSSPGRLVAALEGGDPADIAAALHNDMTGASVGLAPAIGEVVALLESADGVLGACMCGSGSAVFGMAADESAAHSAAEAARGRGWWAVATRTLGPDDATRE